MRHVTKLRKLIEMATLDYHSNALGHKVKRRAGIAFHPAYFRTISRLAYLNRKR